MHAHSRLITVEQFKDQYLYSHTGEYGDPNRQTLCSDIEMLSAYNYSFMKWSTKARDQTKDLHHWSGILTAVDKLLIRSEDYYERHKVERFC